MIFFHTMYYICTLTKCQCLKRSLYTAANKYQLTSKQAATLLQLRSRWSVCTVRMKTFSPSHSSPVGSVSIWLWGNESSVASSHALCSLILLFKDLAFSPRVAFWPFLKLPLSLVSFISSSSRLLHLSQLQTSLYHFSESLFSSFIPQYLIPQINISTILLKAPFIFFLTSFSFTV